MSSQGVEKLVSRLQAVVQTSRECHEVTYGEAIGVLELVKLDLYSDAREEDSEDGL